MDLGEWTSSAGKNLLKIEDGQSVVGTFRGTNVKFYTHWKNKRSTICTGREVCSFCNSQDENDRKGSRKFRMNFIVADKQAGFIPYILEGGSRVFAQLENINKDIPLEKAWVRISRTGKDKNTQYQVVVLPGEKGLITKAEEEQLIKVPLHDVRIEKDDEEDVA